MQAPTQSNTGKIAYTALADTAPQVAAPGVYRFQFGWPASLCFYATKAAADAVTLDPTETRHENADADITDGDSSGEDATGTPNLGRTMLADFEYEIKVTKGLQVFKARAASTPTGIAYMQWSPE